YAAKLFGVSASTSIKWMQRWRKHKSVSPNPVRGHRRSLLEAHADWLLALIKAKPDLTLEEVRTRLKRRGARVSLWTIWNFFDKRHISFKKNSCMSNLNPKKRLLKWRRNGANRFGRYNLLLRRHFHACVRTPRKNASAISAP
ncbi:MAG TPA: hypothetical protein VGC27_10430, partial [Rhizomicrobium sp.]